MALLDEKFMLRCLLLAAKGGGNVAPNPLVGAVLVRNGKILSEGFHEKFGSPHAEASALKGVDARGATLYVSLEPCCHRGGGKKTPPCVPLIIGSGVDRVVVAAKDQNPLVSGRGIAALRAAGVKVKTGVLGNEAEAQNEAFNKFVRTGLPFVAIKMAQTGNGAIGVHGIGNVRISGAEFDTHAQLLRNRYGGILVGIGTVLSDNPRLTCRLAGGRNPARIILDSALSIPSKANVLRNARRENVIVATSEAHDREKRAQLSKLGVKVVVAGKKRVDIAALMCALPKLGVFSVIIEGGALAAKEAIERGVADKAIVCISPKKIAPNNAVMSPFTEDVLSRLKRVEIERMGKDKVITGYF